MQYCSPVMSLHKYLYAEDEPVDHTDPCGDDVYKVIDKNAYDMRLFWLIPIHHRIIVGDDGRGHCYIIEKGGGGGSALRTAFLHYHSYNNSASNVVAQITGGASIQHRHGPSGKIDGYVHTTKSVDADLNAIAKGLDKKPDQYIFILNDCGSFANEFLYLAEDPYYNSPSWFPPDYQPIIAMSVGNDYVSY